MSETTHRASDETKRLAHELAQELAHSYSVSNAALYERVREVLEAIFAAEETSTLWKDFIRQQQMPWAFMRAVVNSPFNSDSEEAEAEEILARMVRDLPRLEARVDRLMRDYGLAE